MLHELLSSVPRDAANLALVLALSFFVGLEREEHKQQSPGHAFGGVRTFPLIGLVSYALALLSPPNLIPWSVGFGVVGALMLISYHRKLAVDAPAGITTEMSALATYAVGGLVQREHIWIASAIGIVSVLLLELKGAMEGLTKRVASNEIITVGKFLVLSVVILPIVPDHDLTRFHLNPFKTWLVVVAVSGVSFGSYLVQRLLADRGGVIVSAILGGAYSSTVTTVALARQAKDAARPNLFAGSILTASGMMYGRLVLLLLFFNRTLAAVLGPAFMVLAAAAVLVGWGMSRRSDAIVVHPEAHPQATNPLALRTALLFALIFVIILVVTQLTRQYLGRAGLLTLAAIMGVTDVDPFILGLAQGGPAATPLRLAAAAIVLAASSNNVTKAIYAFAFADRATGRRSLLALLVLAVIGLIPLAWV
jgi:uncharacterized membrane protein (DUF4010 family)